MQGRPRVARTEGEQPVAADRGQAVPIAPNWRPDNPAEILRPTAAPSNGQIDRQHPGRRHWIPPIAWAMITNVTSSADVDCAPIDSLAVLLSGIVSVRLKGA